MGREHLEGFLNATINKLLVDVIDEVEGSDRLPDADKKYIVNFYTYALTGVLLAWFQGGMKETAQQIVEHLIPLMDGVFHQAVERFQP